MYIALLIITILLLFFLWNAKLWFYHDKKLPPLKSDESKCFSPRCKSIIYKNNNAKAILMIHGFPTCPQMYEYSALTFSENGYDVYAPLIPTFGADYEEFSKTNFTQWFNFINDYYLNLRHEYKNLTVLGVSMGGAMTLKLGELYANSKNKPDSLVVLSAPVIYNSLFKHIITSVPAYMGRTVALFTPYIKPRIITEKPNQDDGAEEWTGYGGTFIKQGISLVWNLKPIYKNLKLINEPIFLMHDKNDKTVPFNNLNEIIKGISSSKKCVNIVEMKSGKHSHHSLLMYRSVQKDYTQRILNFLEDVYGNKT